MYGLQCAWSWPKSSLCACSDHVTCRAWELPLVAAVELGQLSENACHFCSKSYLCADQGTRAPLAHGFAHAAPPAPVCCSCYSIPSTRVCMAAGITIGTPVMQDAAPVPVISKDLPFKLPCRFKHHVFALFSQYDCWLDVSLVCSCQQR